MATNTVIDTVTSLVAFKGEQTLIVHHDRRQNKLLITLMYTFEITYLWAATD